MISNRLTRWAIFAIGLIAAVTVHGLLIIYRVDIGFILNFLLILITYLFLNALWVWAKNGRMPWTMPSNATAGEKSVVKSAASNASSPDDRLFEQALNEVESGQAIKAIWAKSLADSDGDETKTKARYIRLRVETLKLSSTKTVAQLEIDKKDESLKRTSQDSQPLVKSNYLNNLIFLSDGRWRIETIIVIGVGAILILMVATAVMNKPNGFWSFDEKMPANTDPKNRLREFEKKLLDEQIQQSLDQQDRRLRELDRLQQERDRRDMRDQQERDRRDMRNQMDNIQRRLDEVDRR